LKTAKNINGGLRKCIANSKQIPPPPASPS
jgi:hypothetical protein